MLTVPVMEARQPRGRGRRVGDKKKGGSRARKQGNVRAKRRTAGK